MNPKFRALLAALPKFTANLFALLLRKLMARKKIPKSSNFSLRIEDEQKVKLQAAADINTEGDTSMIVRACIRAYVETFERDREVPTPFALVSKVKLEALEAKAEPNIPSPTFPSTASRTPAGAFSLHEDSPKRDAVPAPRLTSPRRALKKMIGKESEEK